MLKIIAPDRRFEFLYRPGGRSIWVTYRSIPKPFPEHDIDDLLKSLKAFRASAESEASMPQRHIMIRDAALMALILMFGPRVGDIASMRLGFHLFEDADGELTVSFPGETTKGKRLLEYALSKECADYIRDYLTNIRPEFSQTGETDAVWISEEGQMLTIANIATIFRLRIKEWLGEEHGPHIARKWLRSSASRRSPQAAFETAIVLGHSPMVSLRYYAEATDRQAGRRHAENLSRATFRGGMNAPSPGKSARARSIITAPALRPAMNQHQTKKAPPEYSDGAALITLPRAAADRWKTTRSSRSG